MNETTVSKGVAALRKSNCKAERISMGGEMFYFKKLTIGMEEELDAIVKANQDLTLKAPERPAADANEESLRRYADDLSEYNQKSAKSFRRLTAEIMKYVLCDESDKPLFEPDDDVYSLLNNVYAENFFRAYSKFRTGVNAEAGSAAAEGRFPK